VATCSLERSHASSALKDPPDSASLRFASMRHWPKITKALKAIYTAPGWMRLSQPGLIAALLS